MARLGVLVALGVAVGAGAKSENKKSTRTKGRTIGEIVGSAGSATATETKSKRTAEGKQEDGKTALCFAGADDVPFRNTTFLPPPITGTTQPSEAALAARDAWRRLEETLRTAMRVASNSLKPRPPSAASSASRNSALPPPVPGLPS